MTDTHFVADTFVPRRPCTVAATLLLALSALLLAGCQRSSTEQARSAPTPPSKVKMDVPQAAQTPEVEIFVDEAMLRPPQAILGGTLHNVAAQRLDELTVEIELTRRADGSKETRAVPVVPATLEPGGKGRFSLAVLSREWDNSRIVRLRSGARTSEVVYKTSPGARRPPERIADTPQPKAAQAPRPKPKGKGDEYLNSPDDPIAIP